MLEVCEGWGEGHAGWSWVLYLWEKVGKNWEKEEGRLTYELELVACFVQENKGKKRTWQRYS
jgi:hypothetical protein